MADEFIMKRGDTLPGLDVTLLDGAAHPIDLTEASGVTIYIRPSRSSTPVLAAAATIGADPVTGEVRYAWPAPQTLPPGVYYVEWEVAWEDGELETFPNDGYALMKIVASLDD